MAEPTFFIDSSGSVVPVAGDDVSGAAGLGWVPASPKQVADYQLAQKYGSAGQQAITGLEAAGDALTLGASTHVEKALGVPAEDIAAREQANPLAHGAGTAAGVAAGLLVPGLDEVAAPGLIAKAGQAATRGAASMLPEAAGLAGRIATKAAAAGIGSAIEGAAYGAGQVVHEAALGDPHLTAQSALATIGLSAALGGGVGAAGGAFGTLAKAAGEKISDALPGWLEDVEAHANLQAAGGDKVLARQLRRKYGEEGSKKLLLELRDEGIIDGPLNTPATVLDRANDAAEKYGKQIGDLLVRADQAGKVDVAAAAGKALEQGRAIADGLAENPFQRTAGQKLQETLKSYEQKFAEGEPSLVDLHSMEMDFGEQVYGLKGQKDPLRTREIEALNKIRRTLSTAVDDGVAESGVPAAEWKAANRGYQVAKTGQKLAQNGVDRLAGNNPLSLTGTIAAAAGLGHGGGIGALAGGALAEAGHRYGSGILGAAARALREATDPEAAAALVNTTAEAISAERMAGADMVAQASSNTPEKVAALSILERLNQAAKNRIELGVGTIVRGSAKASAVSRGEVSAGIARSFGQSPEEARGAFAKRTEQLQKLSQNPELLQDRLSSQVDDWHEHAPKTAQAFQIATARAVAFLSSKVPQPPHAGPLAAKWTPTRAEVSKFQRYYEAVEKPQTILKQAAAGTLTPEAVEAVATVYPELFAQMRSAVVDKLADSPKGVPLRSRLMLSMLLGQDMDGTTSPHALVRTAAIYARPTQQAPQPAPSRADKLSVGNRMLTPSQASAQRGNTKS